eukprot:c34395_g1_i1 orf=84-413(+)
MPSNHDMSVVACNQHIPGADSELQGLQNSSCPFQVHNIWHAYPQVHFQGQTHFTATPLFTLTVSLVADSRCSHVATCFHDASQGQCDQREALSFHPLQFMASFLHQCWK